MPADYPTIQAAIDAATDGCEIIVSPGTYYENINFGGKNVILRSTDPMNPSMVSSTIIDGGHANPVVTFSGSESGDCMLQGFTITNGFSDRGGGIRGNDTLATIEHNTITSNTVSGLLPWGIGGGISDCSGVIQSNTIVDNFALDSGGGLAACAGSILDNTISGNSVLYYGAGAYGCDGAMVSNVISGNSAGHGGGLALCGGTIQSNIISGNSADYEGGGLYGCDGVIQDNDVSNNSGGSGDYGYGGGLCACDGLVQNNAVSSNTAATYGGGLFICDGIIRHNTISGNATTADYSLGGGLSQCDGTIVDNVISANLALAYGGGLDGCQGTIENNIIYGNSASAGGGLHNCDATVRNNIIYSNYASDDGGGLYECGAFLQNNTVYGNSAGDYAGGLEFCWGSIRNCIIWHNSAPDTTLQLDNSSTPSYCCIQDWTGGGVGNIVLDPQFVNPATEDLHLQATSPCIDAGGSVTLAQDFEGDPRPWDGTSEPRGDGSDFDIGADEYIGLIPYDFATAEEGWTPSSTTVFSPPSFVVEAGRLKLVSSTNTNTFGFWQSPDNAIPVPQDYLYRARFSVSTNITDTSRVPQIRLRANASNFQQFDYLTIESAGAGGASPTPGGVSYDLYFVPPPDDTRSTLAFDLLNFDPGDAAAAEVSLEEVLVERFEISLLSPATVIRSYDFATSEEGWTSGGAPGVLTLPVFTHESGALALRSTTNLNTFGCWSSNPADVAIGANLLYRGVFAIRTDVTAMSAVPQMRLRFTAANFQASRTMGIESAGDGANSPGTTDTVYDRLYFLPPANCVGEGLTVSFDLLNFSPDDAPDASLFLDYATIEALSPPVSP